MSAEATYYVVAGLIFCLSGGIAVGTGKPGMTFFGVLCISLGFALIVSMGALPVETQSCPTNPEKGSACPTP